MQARETRPLNCQSRKRPGCHGPRGCKPRSLFGPLNCLSFHRVAEYTRFLSSFCNQSPLSRDADRNRSAGLERKSVVKLKIRLAFFIDSLSLSPS